MISRLRRLRWLAFLLIAVSPALPGSALWQLLPCHMQMAAADGMVGMDHAAMPMADASAHGDMASMAQPHPASDDAGGGEHDHSGPTHAGDCSGCCPPVACTLPDAPACAVSVAMAPRAAAPAVLADRHAPAQPIVEFLPESTAPPLA